MISVLAVASLVPLGLALIFGVLRWIRQPADRRNTLRFVVALLVVFSAMRYATLFMIGYYRIGTGHS